MSNKNTNTLEDYIPDTKLIKENGKISVRKILEGLGYDNGSSIQENNKTKDNQKIFDLAVLQAPAREYFRNSQSENYK